MNNKEIKFVNVFGVDKEFSPKPSKFMLPQWYKDTDEYIGQKKQITSESQTPQTIKKCIPVFDAMTAGYIITTYTDLWVSEKDGLPYYSWPAFDAIAFHPVEQAPLHPNRNVKFSYPKLNSPWGIETPKGYSVLIIPPMHQENKYITILPGIIDTDQYKSPINFPFVLTDAGFQGLIPAGTPVAQVIPFKRDSWKINVSDDEKYLKEIRKVDVKLKTKFFDSYKRLFWTKKEYN